MPPRSQVNWVTSVSVSIVSLLSLSSAQKWRSRRRRRRRRRGSTADLNDDQARAFRHADVSICSDERSRGATLVVRERNDDGASAEEARDEREREREEAIAGRARRRKYIYIERWKSSERDLQVSARLINPRAVWRKWQERSDRRIIYYRSFQHQSRISRTESSACNTG